MRNPYGAVQGALRETRLALSDVMRDYMASKVMESRSKVDLAKVDTQRSLAELSGKRAILAGEADLARAGTEKERFEKGHGLNLRRVTEAETAGEDIRTNRAANLKIAQDASTRAGVEAIRKSNMEGEKLKLVQNADARAQEEEKRKAEEYQNENSLFTPAEISTQLGWGEMGGKLMGTLFTDPNVKIKMKDWRKITKRVLGDKAGSPMIAIVSLGSKAQRIIEKVNAGTATEKDAAALKDIHSTMELLDMMVQDKPLTPKQLEQARDIGLDRWSLIPKEEQENLVAASGDDPTKARKKYVDTVIDEIQDRNLYGPRAKKIEELKTSIQEIIAGGSKAEKQEWENKEIERQVEQIRNAKNPDKFLEILKKQVPPDYYEAVLSKVQGPEAGVKTVNVEKKQVKYDLGNKTIRDLASEYGRYKRNGQQARIDAMYEKYGNENMEEVMSLISRQRAIKKRGIIGGITG